MSKQALPLGARALDLIASRFRLLAEPMRLRLLYALHSGEMSVTELCSAVESTQPNVSKHLKVLLDAGIVARRSAGNVAFYSIVDETVFKLCTAVCEGLRDHLATQSEILSPLPATPRRRGRSV